MFITGLKVISVSNVGNFNFVLHESFVTEVNTIWVRLRVECAGQTHLRVPFLEFILTPS